MGRGDFADGEAADNEHNHCGEPQRSPREEWSLIHRASLIDSLSQGNAWPIPRGIDVTTARRALGLAGNPAVSFT